MSRLPFPDPVPRWPRLLRLMRRFAESEQGRKAVWMIASLLLLVIGVNTLNVVNSYVGRDFITALAERQSDRFLVEAGLYLAVFAVSTVVAVFYRFMEERLGLLWRSWLTKLLIDSFLKDRHYHRLKQQSAIENPDERIAEDVKSFTTTTLSFLLLFLNGSITIVAFSGVIWTISPLLFAVTLAYSAVGSYLAIKLGRPLIGLNYSQLDREANLRSGLIHVWENAEAVAVGQREDHLQRRLLKRVDELTATGTHIIDVHRNLGFFTTGYNYLIQILPALVVAPLYLGGQVEFGVITQSAMAFAHLVGAFSLIVNQFQSISSFAAVIARLGSLGQVMDSGPDRADIAVKPADQRLQYRGVTLPGSAEAPLLRDFSADFPLPVRLGISGSQEQAKEALFKATADLGLAGSGEILRPPGKSMQFLAERPYLPPGSLRQIVGAADSDDVKILDTFAAFGCQATLSKLGGLDAEQDWGATLSLAEQQLLAIAAASLGQPQLLFLNRATSALTREQTCQVLQRLAAGGISYLVIGKVDKYPEYFSHVLDIDDEGRWALRSADIPPAPVS